LRSSKRKRPKNDPLANLTGAAAPVPRVNVDTEIIIPNRFLETIKRTGLAVNLLDEMLYTPGGREIEDFMLNQPAYRNAGVLVAGDSLGRRSPRAFAFGS
jgi:3-isopropylmalate/(R)-2-methylmalate dehydratase small subunit